ncbi:MAG: tetratricopeptide repeat protein [Chlorobi bacterium]|nr:tetratricopeptide repeat protein [Chlorobiota bacterium]MCI0715849.1 tetratricopeptide repeat protein [Chlorobiota bacterium]
MSLKARRKIKHKELKQDKLVTSYFEARNWLDKPENKKKVYTGAAILIGLIAVVFLYSSSRKTKNEEAEVKLSAVITLYEQGKYNEAINGDPAAGITGLNEIVNSYGSTESGETAKLYLGNCYFNLKDYDNALKQFEDYSGDNDIIKASCLSGAGAVYEARGDLKKAGEYFEKSAKVNKEVVINQENLFYAIRAYTQAGDKESASRVYSQLKEEYPKSKYINESKRFESEFKN